MKRYLCLLVALVMVFSMAACGGSSEEKDAKVAGEAASENNVAGTNENAKNEDVKNEDVTVEEQVIYDENSVKVTVKSFDAEAILGPELNVLVENNSSEDIIVQADNVYVNDLMVDVMFSCDVPAGKKSNDSMTFLTSDLELAGIEVFKHMEFDLKILGSDYMTKYESEQIKVTTSVDESYVQKIDDEGVLAVDDENVKIVVQNIAEDEFLGTSVVVYIENKSDQGWIIMTEDVSINGFAVEPMFYCDVVGGKKAFDTITFLESDLEENGITEITDMELRFRITDFANSYETDIVSVVFE